MEDYERRNIEDCIYNIQDKAEAIKQEIQRERPHKYYILEKIELIIGETKCIKNICENEVKN